MTKGTPGFEMYEGFSPKPGEKIFDKTVNSSFKGTGLLEYLREKNVHTVSSGCGTADGLLYRCNNQVWV